MNPWMAPRIMQINANAPNVIEPTFAYRAGNFALPVAGAAVATGIGLSGSRSPRRIARLLPPRSEQLAPPRPR
jgi:hypothetical protein